MRSLVAAFGAQVLIFLCSGLMTLAVPKIMGVTEFAYWQLFIFYTGYVGFLQLGLNDGVYLKYGGAQRSIIDKREVVSQFWVCVAMQILVGVLIMALSITFKEDGGRLFVVFATGIYLIVSNIAYYWGYIFQAMNETRVFSFSQALDRICFLFPLLISIFLGISDFHIYIVLTIVTRTIALVYSLFKARDFLFVKPFPFLSSLRLSLASARAGIVLSVANVCSLLIIGCARIVVDARWGIDAFGKLSIAFSLVNFALAFITQGSMVLFPALKQVKVEGRAYLFNKFRNILGVMLPITLLLYYPIHLLISLWLPQYSDSLKYLLLLMPICVYEAQTNLVLVTFYKVRNEPKALLKMNVKALLISTTGIGFAAWVFNSIEAVVAFAVIGIVSRFLLGNRYLSKQYNVSNKGLIVSQVILVGAYFATGAVLSIEQSLLATILELAFFYLFNNTICREAITALRIR